MFIDRQPVFTLTGFIELSHWARKLEE